MKDNTYNRKFGHLGQIFEQDESYEPPEVELPGRHLTTKIIRMVSGLKITRTNLKREELRLKKWKPKKSP